MNQLTGAVLSARALYQILVASVPTVVDSVLGRVTRETCDARLHHMSKRQLELAQVDLQVEGREYIRKLSSDGVVVMSNHLAAFDIPVLFQVLVGRSMRMVTKAELIRVPIWGDAMLASGFICVDRKQRNKAIENLKAAKHKLDPKIDIWFAPEGTRSRTGELLPFKKGGFRFALDTRRKILPVALSGTENVAPIHTYLVRTGAQVNARIGTPIDTTPFADNLDGLMTHVRRQMEALLPS